MNLRLHRLSVICQSALEKVARTADVIVAHNVLTMHKSLALAEAVAALAQTRRVRVIAWTHDIAAFDPALSPRLSHLVLWYDLKRATAGARSNERAPAGCSYSSIGPPRVRRRR